MHLENTPIFPFSSVSHAYSTFVHDSGLQREHSAALEASLTSSLSITKHFFNKPSLTVGLERDLLQALH